MKKDMEAACCTTTQARSRDDHTFYLEDFLRTRFCTFDFLKVENILTI
jgi:hypothetical protein